MTTVGDVRRRLELLIGDAARDDDISELLSVLGRNQAMSFDSWLASVAAINPSTIVTSMRNAYKDDNAFADLIDLLRSSRTPTKGVLIEAYRDLFGRPAQLRSKATREDVLRAISDERVTRLRTEKMGQLLGANFQNKQP